MPSRPYSRHPMAPGHHFSLDAHVSRKKQRSHGVPVMPVSVVVDHRVSLVPCTMPKALACIPAKFVMLDMPPKRTPSLISDHHNRTRNAVPCARNISLNTSPVQTHIATLCTACMPCRVRHLPRCSMLASGEGAAGALKRAARPAGIGSQPLQPICGRRDTLHELIITSSSAGCPRTLAAILLPPPRQPAAATYQYKQGRQGDNSKRDDRW
jgi:hypothetical protein